MGKAKVIWGDKYGRPCLTVLKSKYDFLCGTSLTIEILPRLVYEPADLINELYKYFSSD